MEIVRYSGHFSRFQSITQNSFKIFQPTLLHILSR